MSINVLETEELDIHTEGITILDFYADWCGPCKAMEPVLEEVVKQTKVNVIKINTDKLPKLASEYQITSIPAMFIYKDGKLVDKKIGASNQGELIQLIETLKE